MAGKGTYTKAGGLGNYTGPGSSRNQNRKVGGGQAASTTHVGAPRGTVVPPPTEKKKPVVVVMKPMGARGPARGRKVGAGQAEPGRARRSVPGSLEASRRKSSPAPACATPVRRRRARRRACPR